MTKLDRNITLGCAMRYALGRKTYVVGSVTNELIENWDNFREGDKKVMIKEIKEAIEKGRAGMDMDVRNWNKILLFEDTPSKMGCGKTFETDLIHKDGTKDILVCMCGGEDGICDACSKQEAS